MDRPYCFRFFSWELSYLSLQGFHAHQYIERLKLLRCTSAILLCLITSPRPMTCNRQQVHDLQLAFCSSLITGHWSITYNWLSVCDLQMILDLFPCLNLAIGPLLTTGHYIRGFSGVRVTQIFTFRCVVVSIIGWACPFVLFLLTIVLYFLLRLTSSGQPLCIFKLFNYLLILIFVYHKCLTIYYSSCFLSDLCLYDTGENFI